MEKSRLGFWLEINFETKNFWGIFYFIAFELFYVLLEGKRFINLWLRVLWSSTRVIYFCDKFAIFVSLLTFEENLKVIFETFDFSLFSSSSPTSNLTKNNISKTKLFYFLEYFVKNDGNSFKIKINKFLECEKERKVELLFLLFLRLREIRLFLLLSKSLRVKSMNYCFKSPPPKFQPQIRSKIAHSIKKVKQGFHRFILKIKKLLISFNSKGKFDHTTLEYRLFKCY